MKYTQTTLDKHEKIVEEVGYIIRYERGTFQSGFCVLEDRKVVVLNKFLPLEGRINTMIDLIPQLKIDGEALSPESKKIFTDIMNKYLASQEGQENTEEQPGEPGTDPAQPDNS
jgi:hypothetical protein